MILVVLVMLRQRNIKKETFNCRCKDDHPISACGLHFGVYCPQRMWMTGSSGYHGGFAVQTSPKVKIDMTPRFRSIVACSMAFGTYYDIFFCSSIRKALVFAPICNTAV